MPSCRITGTNEVIKTYNSAGGDADYSTLQAWEEAYDVNNVVAQQSPILEPYAGVHLDSDALNGATNDLTYFRIIRPISGATHKGIPLSDGSCVEFHSTTANQLLSINEQYASIQDIVGKLNINSATTYNVFNAIENYSSFIGCLAYDSSNAGAGKVNGFRQDGYAHVINCLAHNCDGYGITGGHVTHTWYNNFTENSCAAGGLYVNAGTVVDATNCVFEDGVTNDGTYNPTTCTTDSPTYRDSANDDFHISSADTICNGNGTDLSGAAIRPFNDDIDGKVRTTDWDIGFDQYSPHIKYNGINLRTTAIKINGIDTENIKSINGQG
ncbi:MAG: hypothetical protein ACFFG0_14155 [Candidatus Thorarchaeota archaeon]